MADTLADLGKSAGERYGAPPRERWAPDHTDAAFVARQRGRGAGWNAIAGMLGKPVADVRAKFDKGFDKAFAYGRNRPPAALVEVSERPARRVGLGPTGQPRGQVSVELLEALRDGLTTANAIGARIGQGSDAVSSKLGYCVKCGWASAIRTDDRRGVATYRVSIAGLAKIKAFREAVR